jgi:hypothetical protein
MVFSGSLAQKQSTGLQPQEAAGRYTALSSATSGIITGKKPEGQMLKLVGMALYEKIPLSLPFPYQTLWACLEH